jgi:putative DNA methylase
LAYIEHDFPIEQVNPLAQREANAKRPIYMLHKWWARRLGCVFRTIVLSALIPEEEWRRLDKTARRQGVIAWHWLYYRQCHKGFVGQTSGLSHTGHGCAVELIDRYLKDKIVLDPFMGGGTTVVEALRLGCRVIGVDINPVAWFVVKKSIEPVDLRKLDVAFKQLEAEVAPEILKFYRTPCPSPLTPPSLPSRKVGRGEGGQGGGVRAHLADVMYVFWVKTARCSSCGQKTRLFNSFRLATRGGQDAVVCPACYGVHWVEEGSEWVVCPDCGHAFNPRKGFASGGKFTCEHCGQQDETVAWVRRTGQAPGYEMFALEYYCPTCEEAYVAQGYTRRQAQQMARGYKGAEEADRRLYREACREFEKERATLPLPEGEVYAGMKTAELLNHGLRRWADLFNPRQLLCLGRLLRAIRQIEDRAVREVLVATIADSVNCNNLLCKYESHKLHSVPLFGHHAYWVPDQPVENNLWGAKFGRGTFDAYFDKTRRAVAWLLKPEEMTAEDKVTLGDSPATMAAQSPEAVLNGAGRAYLAARSAEDLSFIPSGSVDAVITDPPYYGNVQYAELSDFFYVWLRLGLPDYPEFAPPLVPKEREIVVNQPAGKDDAFFRQGLLQAFRECHRVLKENGPLVFTFHHESPKAWGAVLEAVLEAGFDVRAVWTYHSETRSGFHHAGIRFDTVIVCRKRAAEPAAVAWRALQDEIAAEVQGELRRLLDNGASLGLEDIFVITMGKALAVYSRHYPQVMHEGGAVQVTQAIEDIEKLVDEQIDAYYGMVVPGWLDPLSRVYLQSLAHRQTVSRDSLVKTCRTRGLEFGELEEAQFIRRSKGQAGLYEVLRPTARAAYLEKRLEEGHPLSPVDRAHWLYLTYQRGRSLREAIPQVYQRGLEEVCTALHRITRDGVYERLAQEIERLKGQGVLL